MIRVVRVLTAIFDVWGHEEFLGWVNGYMSERARQEISDRKDLPG